MKSERIKAVLAFLLCVIVFGLFVLFAIAENNDKEKQAAYIAELESKVNERDVVTVCIAYNEASEESAVANKGKFKITAYCPCAECSGEYGNMTATGTVATANRTIAVDPEVIPYGSKVIIDGQEYIAEDCGGAVKGKVIDIYFDSHEEAQKYGMRYREVFLKHES